MVPHPELELDNTFLKFNVLLKRCEKSLNIQDYAEFTSIVQEHIAFVNFSKIERGKLTESDQFLIPARTYFVNLWACVYLNERYIVKINDELSPYTVAQIKEYYREYYNDDLDAIARAQACLSILTDLAEACTIETVMQSCVQIDNGYEDCTSLKNIIEKIKVYKAEIDRSKKNELPNGSISLSTDSPLSSTMNTDDQGKPDDLSPKTLRIISISFGIVFTFLFFGVAHFYPSPTQFQYRIFNVFLSLTGGAMFAGLPGFVQFSYSKKFTGTGAAMFAVILYAVDPMSMTDKAQTNIKTYKVNGAVYSEESSEPIINAKMIFELTGDITYTDSQGRFELVFEPKSDELPAAAIRISAPTYQPERRLIQLDQNRHEIFYLKLLKTTAGTRQHVSTNSIRVKKNNDKLHIEKIVAAGYIPAVFITTNSVTDHSSMLQSLNSFRATTSQIIPFIQDEKIRSQVVSITYELDDIAKNPANTELIDKSKLKIIKTLQNLCSQAGCKFQIPMNFVDNRYFNNVN